jgi:hypothetical protein
VHVALRAHRDERSGEELDVLVFVEDPALHHPVEFDPAHRANSLRLELSRVDHRRRL